LSGRGFDPLWAGPNATNVPKEADIVDNSSPDIVFSSQPRWDRVDSVQYYRQGLSYSNSAGASLSFSFDGVAIWYECTSHTWNVQSNLLLRYYSEIDEPHGFHTISIDGSEPEQFDGRNSGGQLAQQMLWSKTDLSPGRHTFVLRQYDINGKFASLDFFRSVTIGATDERYNI